MTHEFLPNLPQGLPLRHDRTSIYRLYHEYDRLVTEYNWEKHLLFEQYVYLPNRPAALVPIYYYHTPISGPAVGLAGGVHGKKEFAAPIAIASEIKAIGEIGKDYPMFVIAFLNANYLKDKRFPDTLPGSFKTISSIGDFDHVLPQRQNPHRPRSPKPANPYVEMLAPKLLAIAKEFPPTIFLDLHEDFPWPYEIGNYGHTHIYSDGQLKRNDPVARRCVLVLQDLGIPLRINTSNGQPEKTVNGISSLYNGSIDNFFAAPKLIFDGRPHPGPNVPVVITIETPTEIRGRKVPLKKRVSAQAAIIREIPNLLSIYQDNKTLYTP